MLASLLALLFLLAGAVLLVTGEMHFRWWLSLFESTLGHARMSRLRPYQIADLRQLILLLGAECVLVAALCFLARSPARRHRFSAALSRVRCRPGPPGWRPFVLISAGALALVLGFAFSDVLRLGSLYKEDRLLENLTVVWFLAGSALTGWSVIRLRRAPALARTPQRRLVLAGLTVASVLFFASAMEEISWGQRLFRWSTPAAIQAVNHQRETNLHNLVRVPHQPYPIVSLLLIATLAVGWSVAVRRRIPLLDYGLPHPSQIVLFNAAIVAGLLPRGELFEELMGLASLCYGLRLFAISGPEAARAIEERPACPGA